MKTIKVKHYYEIPSKYTGIVEWHSGSKWWYLNDKLHRIDGPAIEWANGTKYWYLNDEELSYKRWLKKRTKYITTVSKLLLDKRIDK